MGLYGLEEVLGRTVQDKHGKRKFVYYPDADRLRALFWEELGAEAPELVYNPVIRERVEKARLLGLLLWYVTPEASPCFCQPSSHTDQARNRL
jgi:hypothetical protein